MLWQGIETVSHIFHLIEMSENVLYKRKQYQMPTVNQILRFDPEQGDQDVQHI